MKKFRASHGVKKAALLAIARQADESAIGNLKDIFESLDEDNSGTLSIEELKHGMERAGLQAEELTPLMQLANTGHIDYTTFIAATMDARLAQQESLAWSAFSMFDRDGDG